MSLSRVKTWADKERVTANDINTEFDNILSYLNAGLQGTALAPSFTAQGNIDMNFNSLLNVGRIGNMRYIFPGQDVQTIVDELASTETGGIAVLMPGTHALGSSTVVIPDKVSLIGWTLGTATCTSTASTILEASSDTQGESQQIGGFTIQTVAGNAIALSLTGAALATNTYVRNLHVQNGFAGAGCKGIVAATGVRGVFVQQCAFDACQYDIELAGDCDRWTIEQCYFSTSGITAAGASIRTTASSKNLIVRNNYFTADANVPYTVNLVDQVAAKIEGNVFDGASPQAIGLNGNGSTKAGTCRACVIENNTFDGSGTTGVSIVFARGCGIRHNYFGSSYTNATAIGGSTLNVGNFWGPNDVDSTNEISGSATLRNQAYPWALYMPNEFNNSYTALLPTYASTPTEVGSSFTAADQGGYMWIVNGDIDASATTQALHFYDFAGNETDVPLL